MKVKLFTVLFIAIFISPSISSQYLEDSSFTRTSQVDNSFLSENQNYENQDVDYYSKITSEIDSDTTKINRPSNRKSMKTLEDPLDVEPIKINTSDIQNNKQKTNQSPDFEEIEDPW